jgi:hypothetical protein
VPPPVMYVATFILFLIPWSIIWVALKSSIKSKKERSHLDWRSYMLWAALSMGAFATVTAMGFFLSWTHGGGSPHGGTPKPGLWLTFRPIAICSVGATVALGTFAKGKGRLLAIASAISIVLVTYLLAALEMD